MGGLAGLLRDERLRFLVAGAWNTAFGYAVFTLVHLSMGERLTPWAQIALAYAIALPQAFAVQSRFVFTRAGDRRRQWWRFSVANTVIFVANLALVPWLVDTTRWPALAVQAGYLAASTVISYFVHRQFTFADTRL